MTISITRPRGRRRDGTGPGTGASGRRSDGLGAGYAVSIVKAGARIVGRDAAPVRPPLTDLKPAEVEQLAALIKTLGPQ